jgi:transcriptional regulator with XRE-family HTH domain
LTVDILFINGIVNNKYALFEWWLHKNYLCYSAGMEKKIVTSKEIGEAIKRRRRELGISQERLAEMLNVSYQQVQRYESGANKLNVENIQVIADLLSVPLMFFFSANLSSTIAEPVQDYTAQDEKTLLKYFRRIPERRERSVVISVARLAAVKR